MHVQRFPLIFLIMIFLIVLSACSGSQDGEQPAVFKEVSEIQEIKPQKPVKIKLKRSKEGEYSWDISGDNAEEILKADRRLKESLKND